MLLMRQCNAPSRAARGHVKCTGYTIRFMASKHLTVLMTFSYCMSINEPLFDSYLLAINVAYAYCVSSERC